VEFLIEFELTTLNLKWSNSTSLEITSKALLLFYFRKIIKLILFEFNF